MSLKSVMISFEAEIKSILESMKSVGSVPYFEKTEQGRFQAVDIFPCAFFWTAGSVPMGNDYLDGDLIKQKYTVAGYDFAPEVIDNYEEAEARSKAMGDDLRDEFSKWDHRNLQGTVFQMQVTNIFVDPGVAPSPIADGGLMAAGGIEILIVYRQNRGS